jgi:MFS family permease
MEKSLVSITKTGKRWQVLGLLCLIRMGAYFSMDQISTLQHQTEDLLQVTSQQFGFIFSMMSLISVISAPIAGTLMDNYGVVAGLYITTSMVALG